MTARPPQRPYLLFLAHAGLVEMATVFAEQARRRLGLASVAVTHGTFDTRRALHLGAFDHVVDAVATWEPASAAERLHENLARLMRHEQAYGATIAWPAIVQEHRWRPGRYTYEETIDYLAHSLGAIEEVLAGPIIAFVGEVTMPLYRLVHAARTPQRPYLIPMTARFFRRFYFDSTLYLEWPEVLSRYREIIDAPPPSVAAEVDEVIEGISAAQRRPVYFDVAVQADKKASALSRQVAVPHLRNTFVQLWYNSLQEKLRNPQAMPAAYWMPHRKLQRWAERRRRQAFYRRHALAEPPPQRYALYLPNHQPEYTIDTQGWPYRDQAALVRSIAQSLPVDCLLLVKEHRLMLGARPQEFYEEILDLPNVRVVDNRLGSQSLIGGADLLFTVTGTAALEALCLGKPTIMFGRVFFRSIRGITTAEDLFALPELVREALSTRLSPDECRASARAVLVAMHDLSYVGDPFSPVVYRDDRKYTAAEEEEMGVAIEQELRTRRLV